MNSSNLYKLNVLMECRDLILKIFNTYTPDLIELYNIEVAKKSPASNKNSIDLLTHVVPKTYSLKIPIKPNLDEVLATIGLQSLYLLNDWYSNYSKLNCNAEIISTQYTPENKSLSCTGITNNGINFMVSHDSNSSPEYICVNMNYSFEFGN